MACELDALLKILQTLENTPDIRLSDDEYIVRDNPIVLDAAGLAESLLITPTGHCNWDAIDILCEHGYAVFPVERDRFSWLIGGIRTKIGVLLYG